MNGILHVLQSFRAEGCPRLALALLEEERRQTGRVGGAVAFGDLPDDLISAFERAGYPTATLGCGPRDWLGSGVRLAAHMAAVGARAAICYPMSLFCVSAAWAARANGVRLAIHAGSAVNPEDDGSHWRLRLVLGLARPARPRFAACSEHVRRGVTHFGKLPGREVVTIPNGIDLSRFSAVRTKHSAARSSRPLMVGMVASFEEKDQDTLIEAVVRLNQSGRAARLLLAGDGSRRETLRSLTQRLAADPWVEFCGAVRDVPGFLAELDVFAFCVYPIEGLGIALIEALAAGLPAVGSDVPACREVLGRGRLGTIVAGRDPAIWADALWSAARRPPVPLAELARYDIAETFRAYDRLLGRHR